MEILKPKGMLDVLYYYSKVVPKLTKFLKGKELSTKVHIPFGPTLLKRGSKLPPLFAEDLKVKNTGLYIERGITKSAVFIFKPGPEAPGGANVLTLHIKGDNTGYEQTYEIPVYLSKEGHEGYTADFKVSAYIPQEVDPRNDVIVKVDLENRNKKDIENITLNLVSATFETELQTTLGPLEKKTQEIKDDLKVFEEKKDIKTDKKEKSKGDKDGEK